MFTTLRYVKDSALVSEREGHVLAHLACRACRSRKLKCTGESNGCRRCRSKDITCTYPDPSQRTRRSKQVKAKSKQAAPASQAPLTLTNPSASIQTALGHEVTPAVPSPWTTPVFQNSPCSSFLDSFLGDANLHQPFEFLQDDLAAEGAGFFPLDHFSWLDEFHWPGSKTPTFALSGVEGRESSEQVILDTSPPSALHLWSPEVQGSENSLQWISPESSSLIAVSASPTTINNKGLSMSHNSTESRLSKAPDTAASCTCLPSALQTLHLITTNEPHTTIRSIPLTIHLNKHVLNQCKTLFSCAHCHTSIITLLTILCQKVISSYERIIAILTKQFNDSRQLPSERVTVPAYLQIDTSYEPNIAEEGDDERQFKLREYVVEAWEEPCLFTGLVTLQLGILRVFLVKLKGNGEGENAYFRLLEEVDERVLKLGQFCSKSCEV